MRVTKKHKLYFRSADHSVRRLDKASKDIYDFVIRKFLEGDGNQQHNEINKDVKVWQNYKPVKIPIPAHLEPDMKNLTKRKALVISYNSSWLPLAELYYL